MSPPRYESFKSCLEKAAKQWFGEQGYKTDPDYYYRLETKYNWRQNIICKEVADYIISEGLRRNKDLRNKDLHNGLSSQAMAFNLIGPLIVRKDHDPLRVAIERLGLSWPEGEVKATFEYSNPAIFNEKTPTSIDIALLGSKENSLGSANSVFIKAALTERKFGRCSSVPKKCDGANPLLARLENCYLHTIDIQYWEKFKQQGFSQLELSQGVRCPLKDNYQISRNIMLAFDQKGSFVLLHDERNPISLRSTTEKASKVQLLEAIPAAKHDRVGQLTIQALVMAIEESGNHGDWINEFKKKYALS